MGFTNMAVLTMDVVGFSEIKPDYKQLEVIQALIAMLREAIPKEHNHPNALIWSPAGDGGSLTFLNDNSAALDTAIALGRLVIEYNKRKGVQSFKLRTGIHIGAVTKEIDFDDRVNVWGEGVNISARVCGLAKPGQILVSDDFYRATALQTRADGEVVSIGKWWAKHHKPLILWNIFRDEVGIPPTDLEEWYGPFHYPLQLAIQTYEAMMREEAKTGDAYKAAVLAKRLLDLDTHHSQARQVLESISESRFSRAPGTKNLYDAFFSALSPNALVYFFRNAEFKEFNKDEMVVQEGDPADSMMMIVSGDVVPSMHGVRLKTRQSNNSLAETDLVLREGAIIGEMGLFSPGGTRTATLTAAKNTITLTLDYRFLWTNDGLPDTKETRIQQEIQHRIWKSYHDRMIENQVNTHVLFRELPLSERIRIQDESEFLPEHYSERVTLNVNDAWDSWIIVVAGKVVVYGQDEVRVEYGPGDCLGTLRLAVSASPYTTIEVLPDSHLVRIPWPIVNDLVRKSTTFRRAAMEKAGDDRIRFELLT